MTQVKKNNVLQSKSDYNARGELARLSDSAANQVTTYSYDLIGRPVQSTTSLTVGGNSRVIQSSFRYDTLNRLTAQDDVMPRNGAATDPRVGDFNYIYGTTGNASGLIERVQMHKVNRLSYQYDSLGRVTRRTYSTANKNTDYTYVNVSGLRTSSLVESVNNAGETLSYTYDSMGNISTIKKDGVLRESYQYDALGQLTRVDSAVQNKSFAYTYDAGGNLTAVKEYAYTTGTLGAVQNTVAYSYGNSNWKDLLTSYDGQSITYDAIGNPLTYRDGMSMTWSGRNLTGLTKDGQSISYAYDANGLRASKTVDGNTTTYYTSGGVKIGEYRAGTNTDVFYMHDEKGTIYGICINGTTYLFVYNAQGDVIALYDNAGNVHARYTYDAWGKPISITDGSGNDVSGNPNHIANINPFRYRNYYYDTETGFYYLNSRYYDPKTGRFINPDGYVSTGQGLLSYNMFAYCLNNPVNNADPSGHVAASAALLAGGSMFGPVGFVISAIALAVAVGAANDAIKNSSTVARDRTLLDIQADAISISSQIKVAPKEEEKSPTTSKFKPNAPRVHHIVAQNASGAQEARDILGSVDINKNDPRNLVIIPQRFHVGMHTKKYYDYVNERLRPYRNDIEGVEATLAELQIEILVAATTGFKRWDFN